MRRTVKRYSRAINRGKRNRLGNIVRAYAKEKQNHLLYYTAGNNFAQDRSEREQRDRLVKEGYRSRSGVQGRMWKAALKEARETVVKYWAALGEKLRHKVRSKTEWSEAERHYAFWLLLDERRIHALIKARAPENPRIELSEAAKRKVRNYLRRQARKCRGRLPQVRMARSMVVDADMYDVGPLGVGQVINVMGVEPRQRIAIPLRGNAEIKGTVRVVVQADSDRVEVHQTHPLEGVLPELTGDETETAGVDIGITEVLTDEQGNRYGTELGSFLEKTSEQLLTKGHRRNKLQAVRKAAWTTGDREKASRIRKFNLGKKKQREMTRKQRQTAARIINTAIYSLVAVRQMKILGVENLDFRTPTPSKALSRRVMLLSRSLLNERLDFVASVKRFRREDTNCAYSSQTCPNCWFPHPANRRGDRFQCTHIQCRHADMADRVGAEHTKRRVTDPEIRTWTPRPRVKEILLARHLAWKNARLEPPERPVVESPPDDGKVDCCGADSRCWATGSRGNREDTTCPQGRAPEAHYDLPATLRTKLPKAIRSRGKTVGAKHIPS